LTSAKGYAILYGISGGWNNHRGAEEEEWPAKDAKEKEGSTKDTKNKPQISRINADRRNGWLV